LHIFLFIFTHGSSPGKDSGQDAFIDATCAPSGLLKTVLTFGYLKATWRRFFNYYRLIFFPQKKAVVGKLAPDCKVVDLNGEIRQLSTYIKATPKGMPLILNFGSYT
jgi:hypothetical protein